MRVTVALTPAHDLASIRRSAKGGGERAVARGGPHADRAPELKKQRRYGRSRAVARPAAPSPYGSFSPLQREEPLYTLTSTLASRSLWVCRQQRTAARPARLRYGDAPR